MADSWSLLLILAAVYLFECLLWLRRGGVAFTSWLGKRWALRFPGLFISNWKGGIVLLPPFPPLGQVLSAEQPLLSLNEHAVFSYSAASVEQHWRPVQPARFFAFDGIKSIETREKKIRINGELFLVAASECHAVQIARMLRRLHSLPSSKRPDAIRHFISESLNTTSISERLEALRKHSRRLGILANVLFFYLFAVVPGVFWFFGLRASWVPLLSMLLTQTTAIAIIYRRAHKRLFTEPNADWFTPFFTMLLAPSAAIRAKDALSKHLLVNFHPVAVAQLLCSPEEFQPFARYILRDLQSPRLPICPSRDHVAVEVERSFRGLIFQQVSQFLTDQKLDVNALCQAPLPSETVHRSFCPRCETQFVSIEGTCNECGGITLQPL